MKRILLLSIFCISLLTINAQKHTLPKHLSYEALEPMLDSLSMYIHINSYHKKYVDQLNKSVIGTADSNANLTQLLIHSSKLSDLTRHSCGGHYNHSLFWDILTTNTSLKPSDALNAEIVKSFYSVDSMKTLIIQSATRIFGSGWVWVIVTPDKKLQITTTINEENPLMDKFGIIRGMPILCIDLWEHAYFLRYQGNKKEYLQSVLKLLDWDAISKKYSFAKESEALSKIEKSVDWPAFLRFQHTLKGLYMNIEKGEMLPIKAGSANILALAKALDSEPIPTEFATEPIKGAIKNILVACTQLNDVVVKKGTDAQVKEKFVTIKDPYKIIVGSFSKKEDQNSQH